ncbi:MAG: penicillin-binding protein [Candidatus Nomurabacteria bacterium]|nr:penicillin-binding protein [Candidatus Nomurabacteria bacterium]USN87319.1 MAG: penicillin-binding protein [Candidatus Nomurabacteria bacterium]
MRIKKLIKFPLSIKNLFIDLFIVLIALGIILSAVFLIWISTLKIPDLSSFEERRVLQSTKIYDRTGEILLYDLHQDVRRTVVPFEDINRHIKNATIAIEDDEFYKHHGIEPKAIIRAVVTNLTQGDLLGGQGGSTITQQVVKNSLLQNEKTLTRKVKEWILAIKLEKNLSKDEILAIYLNESPYGGTIYGVEEAAQSFFGKHASELTLAESAYIASLPQAPTFLSPYGNHRDELDKRQKLVLERMLVNNFINQEEYSEAVAEIVTFQPQAVGSIRAPHFVMYIREQLVQKYGEEALSERGLRVITTLDWDLQKEAERIVYERGLTNVDKFKATNAGLVAVDPKTGDLLTMVGSRDYFSEDIDGNFNVALATRQPGSSIKPFIYAKAFEKGYLPDTVVFDVKTQFSPLCAADSFSSESPCYSPNNYNHKTIGPINLRNALAQSLNIPAVKTLYLAGIKDSLKLASDMGLTTLNDPDRYGLTLVLGGGEVRLIDMAYAYGVFANEGIKAEPRSILRIEDTRGNIIEESQISTKRVLDKNAALMISDVLSDNIARTPLWGTNSPINFPNRDVAAKSGSTNNLRDAWIMGYAPNIAVGAWVGNNDNSPMGGGLSGLITTPMWREFMDVALEKLPEENFTEPTINRVGVKPIIRGEYIDTSKLFEIMASGDEINADSLNQIYNDIHNILHYVNKNDPQGPTPSNPRQDDQYDNWEYAVQLWKNETYNLNKTEETTNQN